MRGHEGKAAAVTGAAQGIGQAYAVRLAAEGVRVAVVDVQDAGDTLAACKRGGGEAIYLNCEVSDPDAVEAMAADVVRELGGCDVLVNNVAGCDQWHLWASRGAFLSLRRTAGQKAAINAV